LRRWADESSLADYGWQAMHGFHYVYRLRSCSHPAEVYTGITQDLDERIRKHNSGSVPHTAKYRPWELEIAIAFRSQDKAAAFESYLKSGSGREFARRHF
jgi:predicted GIY-YIG superfamily endonuclease